VFGTTIKLNESCFKTFNIKHGVVINEENAVTNICPTLSETAGSKLCTVVLLTDRLLTLSGSYMQRQAHGDKTKDSLLSNNTLFFVCCRRSAGVN
jgi:hypothetical protein